MPLTIKDLDNGIGAVIIGEGVVTDPEYISAFKAHLTQNHNKFEKYRYSLSDYTEITKAEVTNEAIKFVADLCISAQKINPSLVHATVASQNLIFGLSRMAEALRDQGAWETMVFRTKKEAVTWLEKKVKDKFGLSVRWETT